MTQLLLIVFAMGYANDDELFVVFIKMNQNKAKRKSWKTRPFELDHLSRGKAC